jgi:hypothetical protein
MKEETKEENGKEVIKYKRYELCEEIGTLSLSLFKKICICVNPNTENLAKSLGLGPSLFLMSTKMMGWFFLFLFLFNVPVMFFYYNCVNNSGIQSLSGGVSQMFSMLSIGNVGQSGLTCNDKNNVLKLFGKNASGFGSTFSD